MKDQTTFVPAWGPMSLKMLYFSTTFPLTWSPLSHYFYESLHQLLCLLCCLLPFISNRNLLIYFFPHIWRREKSSCDYSRSGFAFSQSGHEGTWDCSDVESFWWNPWTGGDKLWARKRSVLASLTPAVQRHSSKNLCVTHICIVDESRIVQGSWMWVRVFLWRSLALGSPSLKKFHTICFTLWIWELQCLEAFEFLNEMKYFGA